MRGNYFVAVDPSAMQHYLMFLCHANNKRSVLHILTKEIAVTHPWANPFHFILLIRLISSKELSLGLGVYLTDSNY